MQLTELVLTATQRHGVFIFGIDCIPDTWRQLSNLRCLEVCRGRSGVGRLCALRCGLVWAALGAFCINSRISLGSLAHW